VRNAADFELFHLADSAAELAHIPRPIVGYFGAIADWFDFDLLRSVALSRPGYSFVLVGGLGLEQDLAAPESEKLRDLPNVHLPGHKSYDRMPSFLSGFDACTIPFRLNEVTMATDPVKLYEYLSQGKPVVATAMRELEPFSELIYIASGADDFARKLDLALAEDSSHAREKRMEFARANSWKARYQAVDAAVAAMFPLVSILIVTHNSGDFIRPCLEAISRNTSYPRYEVVVVDNASQDGTAEIVREHAGQDSRLSLVRLEHNQGFARANNLAASQAKGAYLLLLNADTLVTPGWVERLMRVFRTEPGAGLAGPVTNWAGNEMKINVSYANRAEMEEFALEIARRNRCATVEVAMAPLFCTLVPRTVWDRVGPLDESFDVGMFEDDDFAYRVRRAGLRVLCVEDCFVHHFGQGSFDQLPRDEYQRIFERNRKRFEEKWQVEWAAHSYRASVTEPGRRFTPAEFCA
jgi:GT2 family glycosyltransferase